MKGILLILAALALYGCGSNAPGPYAGIVEAQLARYPKSTLQDVYKSFFQDKFGPDHLVKDTASARQYFHYELQLMCPSSMPYYESAGAGENFYRVNLSLVLDSVVGEDEFFNAFIKSLSGAEMLTVEEWRGEWNEILKDVPSSLPGFKADKARIDSILASGDYVVHHSDDFNSAYHPHYRLIHKSVFESELLPLIPADAR